MPRPPRGVYEMPFDSDVGLHIVCAVTSQGRRIREECYTTEAEGEAVTAELWEFLDRRDPPRSVLRAI